MEVIVLRGSVRDVRELADALLNPKGVKYGKLFLTVAAKDITQHDHSHKAKTGAR